MRRRPGRRTITLNQARLVHGPERRRGPYVQFVALAILLVLVLYGLPALGEMTR